ncbi:MAG: hypothetical protein HN768_14975 [Rhodospirillaceae bacterium]|nr:hypothetical protein [Rhodospirillaceae bacterium]
MTAFFNHYDPEKVTWLHVTDPGNTSYQVDFEYSLLGYDLESGRLDMLLRFIKQGHCRRHRHRASTMALVLEGEQHLDELQPDGTTKRIVRKKGDYALTPVDALPHDEWGGEDGGTVIYSLHAPDGIIFEFYNEDMTETWTTSIEEYVEKWNNGKVYGWRTDAA